MARIIRRIIGMQCGQNPHIAGRWPRSALPAAGLRYDECFVSRAMVMVRNKLSALRVAGLFCLCLLAGIVQAAELAKPVRIGVLAYRGAEQAEREWQAHADYLSKTARQHFRIVPLDYKALDEAVARRSIELLITNTGHYTELEATGQVSRIATRLVAGPHGPINRFGGTAIALASRNDLAHYRDLKGKRLLIPTNPVSAAGRRMCAKPWPKASISNAIRLPSSKPAMPSRSSVAFCRARAMPALCAPT
jgi:hypothetical protein